MRRLDTLNLEGDGDDVLLVTEAEAFFAIRVSDDEARSVETVGEYSDLIAGKLSASADRSTACFSQITFHRLRRAAVDLGVAERLTPQSPISVFFSDCGTRAAIRARWKALGERSELELPKLCAPGGDRPSIAEANRSPWISWMQVGVPTLGVTVLFGQVMSGGYAIVAGIVAFALFTVGREVFKFARRTIPERIRTVGDLCEEAAGHSFDRLMAEKASCHPNDVWFAVVALCRRETGFRDPIQRETTFFATSPAVRVAD
ncbi:hypothetical protein ACFOWB_04120 [Chenggangzhangella methanolivorans]|uniref:hypothetical protein n=1 Tax=Chenggangzhangella methanolivorans TaxID=1437009 RepID=UPI003610CC68